MSGLNGEESAGSSDSGSSRGSSGSPGSTPESMAGSTPESPEPSTAASAEDPPAGLGRRIRIWFVGLFRSATALVVTLLVLAVCGGVADVVLHVTRHTGTNSTSFAGIDAVNVVLDGDVSLNVVGRSNGDTGATLSGVDTSTVFDDPIRSTSVIGGTLYLTERCPDSRCTAQLTLDINSNDQVTVVAGNALRLDDAVIDVSGVNGQTNVQLAPGKLVVTNTIVTGAVMGVVECDADVDCRGVATPPNATRTIGGTVEG